MFLTGSATNSIVNCPPVKSELLVACGDVIAQPLTTGDQYDLARELSEATKYGRDCRARMQELIDAVKTREKVTESIK